MSVIRIVKEKDYSVIPNPILRDDRLSVKARFVLLFCLSLADSWEYSIAGLSKAIGNIGIDATRTALQELEKYGYLVRSERKRTEKGYLDGRDYVFFEVPNGGYTDRSTLAKKQDEPISENSILDEPILANKRQYNTNTYNTNKNKIKNYYYNSSGSDLAKTTNGKIETELEESSFVSKETQVKDNTSEISKEDVEEIIAFYEENFETKLNNGRKKSLTKLAEQYSIEEIKNAIIVANERNKNDICYIRGILFRRKDSNSKLATKSEKRNISYFESTEEYNPETDFFPEN